MSYAILIAGGHMNISFLTKTVLNAPWTTAKFRHGEEQTPSVNEQSMQAADKLTLTDEVRKLLKKMKTAEAKKTKESETSEWEDIYEEEDVKRGSRPDDPSNTGD
jgi:Spy/CpxP family protein refolding chaperone